MGFQKVKAEDALEITSTIDDIPRVTNITAQQMTCEGGQGEKIWSAINLPPGIEISPSGRITGNTSAAAGTYLFVRLFVTDAAGNKAGKLMSIEILTPSSVFAITTTSLPAATAGSLYSHTMAVTGAVAPVSWGVSGQPPGLSINASTGVLGGIPTTAGTYTCVFVCDDATAAAPATKNLVITVGASILDISTTSPLPNAEALSAYSYQLESTGGQGTKTWSQVIGVPLPTWMSLSSSGLITGTPSAAAAAVTIRVKVTDSSSPTAQTKEKNLSITVQAAASTAYTRRFGMGRLGSGDERDANVTLAKTEIAKGTNRWAIMRMGVDWYSSVAEGGAAVGLTNIKARCDNMNVNGVKAHIGANYNSARNQRRYRFKGTTHAGNIVRWTSGVMNGGGGIPSISQQCIDSGGGPVGGTGFHFREASVHGPGIDFLMLKGTIAAGNLDVIQCDMPTDGVDEPGADVNWVGKPIQVPSGTEQSNGIKPGTTITQVLTASPGPGVRISQAVNSPQSNRTFLFGTIRAINNIVDNGSASDLVMDGAIVAGKSGTYYIGGTNQTSTDTSFQCHTPSDYGDFCGSIAQILTATRIDSIELGNELNHPLGAKPFVDAVMQYKMFCHGYAAIKAVNEDIIVVCAGAANREESTGAHFVPEDWYERIMDAANATGTANGYGASAPVGTWISSTYFADVLSDYGVAAKVNKPKVPWDVTAVHSYTNDPLNGPSAMPRISRCYNIVNSRGGGGANLPIQCTEQGPDWRLGDTALPGNQTTSNALSPHGAFLWNKGFMDIMFGNIRWPYSPAFTGEADLSSVTATLAQRRAAAKRVFHPWIMQAIRGNNAWPDAGMWEFDGNVGTGASKIGAGTSPAIKIASGSNGLALPQATIHVDAVHSSYPAAGYICIDNDTVVQYTGKTGTSFTGCTLGPRQFPGGGSGKVLATDMKVHPANDTMDALAHAWV